jgi:hypothetical protein
LQVDQQALSGKNKARSIAAALGKENGIESPKLAALSFAPAKPALGGRTGSVRKPLATTTYTALNASGAADGVENVSPKVAPMVDMDKEAQLAAMVCSIDNKDECLMCGS